MNSLPLLTLLALSSTALAGEPLSAEAPILIPDSKGSFDFIRMDEANHRVLACHTGNNTLDVFDAADGKLLKKIPTGKCQDVAVDGATGKYFVSVSKEKNVSIIDSKKLEKTGEIKLAGEADACVFNPKNHCLYAGEDDAKNLFVVDTVAGKVTTSITIPEGPELVVYDAVSDRIFQNIKSNDTLQVIDPNTNTIKASWSTTPAAHPHGLVFNPKTHHLLCAGNNGKLAIIDATSGKVIGSVDIAAGVDQVAFDTDLQRAYCASGKGEVTTVQDSATGATALGTLKTNAGAKTITCDSSTHACWIAYGEKDASYLRRLHASK